MARKKLDEERIPKILDAFEHCVLKYGISETSLKLVAEEANISRTTIHHYIGGREELIKATFQRIADTWVEGIEHFVALNTDDLFDYMLTGWKEEIGHRLDIIGEFERAISRDSEISSAMSNVLDYFFQAEGDNFQRLYPSASPEKCKEAGIIIYSLAMGLSRISDHIEQPSNEVLRLAMKSILDVLLSDEC